METLTSSGTSQPHRERDVAIGRGGLPRLVRTLLVAAACGLGLAAAAGCYPAVVPTRSIRHVEPRALVPRAGQIGFGTWARGQRVQALRGSFERGSAIAWVAHYSRRLSRPNSLTVCWWLRARGGRFDKCVGLEGQSVGPRYDSEVIAKGRAGRGRIGLIWGMVTPAQLTGRQGRVHMEYSDSSGTVARGTFTVGEGPAERRSSQK